MKPQRIERLYAWIASRDDGQDGIPAVMSLAGPMPLVGADKDRIESFRRVAEASLGVVDEGATVIQVSLVEFTGMVVLETHRAKN